MKNESEIPDSGFSHSKVKKPYLVTTRCLDPTVILGNSTRVLERERCLQKAFSAFGDIKIVDIPMLDPYRSDFLTSTNFSLFKVFV